MNIRQENIMCLSYLQRLEKAGETTKNLVRSFSESEGGNPVTHYLLTGLEPNVF